jgi:mRNA interferase MazF
VVKNSAAGRQMGIITDSVIVIDDLATVKEPEVDKILGSYPAMGKVDEALKALFGLD